MGGYSTVVVGDGGRGHTVDFYKELQQFIGGPLFWSGSTRGDESLKSRREWTYS